MSRFSEPSRLTPTPDRSAPTVSFPSDNLETKTPSGRISSAQALLLRERLIAHLRAFHSMDLPLPGLPLKQIAGPVRAEQECARRELMRLKAKSQVIVFGSWPHLFGLPGGGAQSRPAEATNTEVTPAHLVRAWGAMIPTNPALRLLAIMFGGPGQLGAGEIAQQLGYSPNGTELLVRGLLYRELISETGQSAAYSLTRAGHVFLQQHASEVAEAKPASTEISYNELTHLVEQTSEGRKCLSRLSAMTTDDGAVSLSAIAGDRAASPMPTVNALLELVSLKLVEECGAARFKLSGMGRELCSSSRADGAGRSFALRRFIAKPVERQVLLMLAALAQVGLEVSADNLAQGFHEDGQLRHPIGQALYCLRSLGLVSHTEESRRCALTARGLELALTLDEALTPAGKPAQTAEVARPALPPLVDRVLLHIVKVQALFRRAGLAATPPVFTQRALGKVGQVSGERARWVVAELIRKGCLQARVATKDGYVLPPTKTALARYPDIVPPEEIASFHDQLMHAHVRRAPSRTLANVKERIRRILEVHRRMAGRRYGLNTATLFALIPNDGGHRRAALAALMEAGEVKSLKVPKSALALYQIISPREVSAPAKKGLARHIRLALLGSRPSASALRVLSFMLHNSGQSQAAALNKAISVETLCNWLGYTRNGVRLAIKQLRHRGYVRRCQGGDLFSITASGEKFILKHPRLMERWRKKPDVYLSMSEVDQIIATHTGAKEVIHLLREAAHAQKACPRPSLFSATGLSHAGTSSLLIHLRKVGLITGFIEGGPAGPGHQSGPTLQAWETRRQEPGSNSTELISTLSLLRPDSFPFGARLLYLCCKLQGICVPITCASLAYYLGTSQETAKNEVRVLLDLGLIRHATARNSSLKRNLKVTPRGWETAARLDIRKHF